MPWVTGRCASIVRPPAQPPARAGRTRRNVGVDTSYAIRYFVAHHARDMIICNVLFRRDAVFGVLKVGDASGSGANRQQG
jgi:hypothetical protein